MEGLLFIAFTSFMIALSGALMPGPMLTVTIAGSSERGFWVGPLVVLGHGLLELILVTLVLGGLGPFLTRPPVLGTVGIAGGIVLWWLGAAMVRSARRLRLPGGTSTGVVSGSSVVHGILTSLSNPYWTLWWATIGMGYLASALRFGVPGVLFFFVGHILADLLWYSAVSYAVSRGRELIPERIYQGGIAVCGFFLILFGGWFLYFGWQSL